MGILPSQTFFAKKWPWGIPPTGVSNGATRRSGQKSSRQNAMCAKNSQNNIPSWRSWHLGRKGSSRPVWPRGSHERCAEPIRRQWRPCLPHRLLQAVACDIRFVRRDDQAGRFDPFSPNVLSSHRPIVSKRAGLTDILPYSCLPGGRSCPRRKK